MILLWTIVFLLTHNLSNAFPGFVAQNSCLLYEYEANVKVGLTNHNQSSYSHFNGYLKLCNHENNSIAYFTDLNCLVYNGLTNMGKLSPEMITRSPGEDTTRAFQIVYRDGKLDHILIKKGEKEFSRNIKKAIASLLQVDLSHVDVKHAFEYTLNENNIYGNGNVHYTIIPYKEKKIVNKILDMKSFTNWKNNEIFDELLIPNNTVTYIIRKGSENFIIKRADSFETVKIKSDFLQNQYMTVSQTLKLVNRTDIDTKYLIPSENEDAEIKIDTEINVMFNEERLNDKEYLFEKTIIILEELVLFKKQKITDQLVPEINYYVQRLKKVMTHYDITMFEYAYNLLQREPEFLAYFEKLIPIVGTKSSTIFVRNLIRSEKVNDDLAVNMLKQASHSIRHPSEDLLVEILDLLTLNATQKVQNAAVLSFATIIHKTFVNNKSKALDAYIDNLLNKITTTEDPSTQYLYISALYNIKVGSITEKLLPIIRGEYSNVGPNVRYLAMCAAYSDSVRNPEKSLQIYWPIMTNRSLTLDLRIGAYTILTANPRYGTLFFINAYLETEPDKEFYSFHYKYMESMASGTSPLEEEVKEVARKMIKTMRKPFGHQLSGHYLISYKDPTYGYDYNLNTMVISTETSKAVYFDFSSVMLGIPMGYDAMWIKISGHAPRNINEYVILDGYNIYQIIEALATIAYSEKCELEISLLKNDQVVFVNYYSRDEINPEILFDIISVNKNTEDIAYDINSEIIVPNSMGFPARFHFDILSYFKTASTLKSNNDGNIFMHNYQNQLRYSKNLLYYTEFYNTFTGEWQGIEQSNSVDYSLPINLKLTVTRLNFTGYVDRSFKFTFYKDEDENKNKMVVHNHARSKTYIGDACQSNIYRCISCCLYIESSGEKINRNLVYKNTLKPSIFGLNTSITLETENKEDVLRKINKLTLPFLEFNSSYFQRRILPFQNILERIVFSAHTYPYQSTLVAFPQDVYDHIDFKVKMFLEYFPQETYVSLFFKKINLHASYDIQNELYQTEKAADLHAVINFNTMKTKNNLKIVVKKFVDENKNWFVCVDGRKEWLKDYVNGVLKITEGSTDKCLEETSFEVTMKGERSDEQKNEIEKFKNKNYKSEDCNYVYDPVLPSIITKECIAKLTSYRNYTYDIKQSEKFQEFIKTIPFWILRQYINEEKNQLNVVFPIHADELIIQMKCCKNSTENTLKPFIGFYPDNIHFYQGYHLLDSLQIPDSYIFHKNMFKKLANDRHTNITEFGVQVITKQSYRYNNNNIGNRGTIYIVVIAKEHKMNDDVDSNKMILQIEESGRVLEALDRAVTVDGSALDLSSYHHDSWFSGGLLPDNTLMFYIHEWDIYVDYNGEYIRVVTGPLGDI